MLVRTPEAVRGGREIAGALAGKAAHHAAGRHRLQRRQAEAFGAAEIEEDRGLRQGGSGRRLAGAVDGVPFDRNVERSEEHTSELQSLMRISYSAFCLKKNIYIAT